MKTKKASALLLVFAVICSIIAPTAYAAEISDAQNYEEALMEKIALEIDAEKEAVFASVYEQLEEQDALPLMDKYVELFTPRIEKGIYEKYGMLSSYEMMTTTKTTTSQRANNGGVLYYTQMGSLVEIEESYFPPEKTESMIAANKDRASVREAIWENIRYGLGIPKATLTVAGWLKLVEQELCKRITRVLGTVKWSVGTLLLIDKIMTSLPIDLLARYDNYSCVTDMYDPVENYKASVVTAWTKHPYVEWDTSMMRGEPVFIPFDY